MTIKFRFKHSSCGIGLYKIPNILLMCNESNKSRINVEKIHRIPLSDLIYYLITFGRPNLIIKSIRNLFVLAEFAPIQHFVTHITNNIATNIIFS